MSWQSTLLNLVLRLRRSHFKEIEDLDKLRKSGQKMDRRLAARVGKKAELGNQSIAGVSCDTYIPLGSGDARVDEARLVLLFHGGAYCLHSPNMYRLFLASLCEDRQWQGIAPDYRLAPEHPHPAAIDDCFSVYQGLLEKGYRAQNIAIVGDSAGGGLALSVIHKAKHQQLPLPACTVLLSPGGDWSLRGASFYKNQGRDPMFNLSSMLFFRDLYLNGYCVTDPEVSPVYGDFSAFPPTFLTASSTELMRDIAVEINEKVNLAGGCAKLEIGEGLCHDYPLMSFLPESRRVRTKIVEFCRSYLD